MRSDSRQAFSLFFMIKVLKKKCIRKTHCSILELTNIDHYWKPQERNMIHFGQKYSQGCWGRKSQENLNLRVLSYAFWEGCMWLCRISELSGKADKIRDLQQCHEGGEHFRVVPPDGLIRGGIWVNLGGGGSAAPRSCREERFQKYKILISQAVTAPIGNSWSSQKS